MVSTSFHPHHHHLLRSSVFSFDPQEKQLLQLSQDQRPLHHHRFTYLIQNRSISSSSSSFPSSSSSSSSSNSSSVPSRALREHPVASARSHASIHRDQQLIELPPKSWSEVEILLTELQRSLLETQWTLTSDQDKYLLPKDELLSNRDDSVVSRRASARERRINSRNSKRKYMKSEEEKKSSEEENVISFVYNSSAKKGPKTPGSAIDSNKRGKKKISRIDEALATVTTLGLKGKRELLTKEEEVMLAKKMKVGQNLKTARRKLINVLGCEPSDEMWASSVSLSVSQVQSRILDAERARDQMFVSNLRLVFSVANKYTSLGVTLSDLIQEGALGLLRGLEKFNYKKGFKLSTYVHWWIRQGITRALANHSRTIRLPAHMHERLNAINKAAIDLRLDGEMVSVKSLSEAVRMSDEMVALTLKATKKMVSLDKGKRWGFSNREEDSMHNYIADPSADTDPWIAVDKICMRGDVDKLLAKYLNKREREIVRLHYGLDHPDGRGLSLDKISYRYGISRERTRQIEGCAFRKLSATGLRKDFDIPLLQ